MPISMGVNKDLQALQAVLKGVGEKFAAFQETTQRSLVRIDWEATQARLEELSDEASSLGEQGWTLPVWATPREVADILEGARERPIDDVFEEYFAYEDGLFFRQLKRSILASEALDPWKPLIEECFWAYENERFLLVVPSMITVIEGAVIAAGGPTKARAKDPKQTAKQLRAKSKNDWFSRAVWGSIHTFLQRLFESLEFSGEPPPHLNRAWILHGRAFPEWSKSDCLRLFQAADTVGAWR